MGTEDDAMVATSNFETLPELLEFGTREWGERMAFRSPWGSAMESVTFRELELLAAGAAEQLAPDVERGEFVLIGGRNSIPWVVTLYALLLHGAIPVPVDTEMPSNALNSILRELQPAAVVGDETFLARVSGISGKKITLAEVHDWPAAEVVPVLDPPAQPDELAVLLYTGGTTGRPKGVMLSHRNLVHGVNATVDGGDLRMSDVLFVVLPLFHVFPLTVGCLAPMAAGLPVELEYRLTRVSQRASETPPTIILGVPALWEALLRTVERNASGGVKGVYFKAASLFNRTLIRTVGINLGRVLFMPLQKALGGNLRYLVSGGARLDPTIQRRMTELGLPVIQGYGLSEAAPVVSVQRFVGRRYWWRGRYYWKRIGSVGTPLTGVTVTIEPREGVDEESGEGELVVQAPNVMMGYYERPADTAAILRDGALHTGDLARIDDNGDIWITGRASLVISMPNGKQVNLETMEAELLEAPEIAQIRLLVELEPEWKLVAVVFPSEEALAGNGIDGSTKLMAVARDAVRRQSRGLPSWLRVDEVRLSGDLLPVTRLGKLRRATVETGDFDFDHWCEEAHKATLADE
jgi:long-chain acyl-CoA synthetase